MENLVETLFRVIGYPTIERKDATKTLDAGLISMGSPMALSKKPIRKSWLT